MWLRPCDRQMRRADARQLLGHDDLLVEASRPCRRTAFGQCGAIQPLRDSVRYHGINSSGGGRAVRPRSAAGRLASSHVRTSLRNSASAGVS